MRSHSQQHLPERREVTSATEDGETRTYGWEGEPAQALDNRKESPKNERASKQAELSCDPEIPLLRNYPKMMETLSERQLCPFTAALFTTATGEDNLSARLWMNGTEKHGLRDRTALSSTGRHPAVRDSTDGPRGRRGERNEPEEDKPCAPPPTCVRNDTETSTRRRTAGWRRARVRGPERHHGPAPSSTSPGL